jgi:hypothetical protein
MPMKNLVLVIALALDVAAIALLPFDARASPTADGWVRTGEAVQTANHWPFTMDVFAIWHEVKELPATRSRQSMIDLLGDKRFALRMLRDVDADRLRAGLREGYRRNGFDDGARIDRLLAPLSGTLPKDRVVWIAYDGPAARTRLVVEGGATATVDGVDFMRATWSIWFGKSKPADLGDALAGRP